MNENQLYAQMRHDHALVRPLMPGHGSLDLELVIAETISHARVNRCATWQDAWNIATGATPTQVGWFRFSAQVSCPNCRGRKYDPRTAKVCSKCIGRGRVQTQIRQQANYARTPEPTSDDQG